MSYTHKMILIGKSIIVEFASSQPQSRKPLTAWERIIKDTQYQSFNDLKKAFRSADYVSHQYTIFDISGNKYRLITEINYPASVVRVKKIWTHAEYSMKKNKDAIMRGAI